MGRLPFNQPIQTRALSSVYGKIEQLLIAYPGGMANVSTENILERYGEIFKAFNDRVTFVILGHFGGDGPGNHRGAFESALRESHIDPSQHLVLCHTPLAGGLDSKKFQIHSEYIQDPFVIMESNHGTTILLESIRQSKIENEDLAEQLAASAGFLIQPSLLDIEGGNILIGDDFAFIGENTRQRNLELGAYMNPDDPQNWVETYFREMLGLRYVIWVGTESEFDLGEFVSNGAEKRQPLFHIDLFTTLTGKTKSGKEGVLLAKIDKEYVKDRNASDDANLDRINAELDKLETKLNKYGEEIPGPLFEVQRNLIGGKMLESRAGVRKFIPYSTNNAQVECYQNLRRIYIPKFPNCDALDKKLKKQLNGLGFNKVKFIKNGFEDYALNAGSLHCISSVLARQNQ